MSRMISITTILLTLLATQPVTAANLQLNVARNSDIKKFTDLHIRVTDDNQRALPGVKITVFCDKCNFATSRNTRSDGTTDGGGRLITQWRSFSAGQVVFTVYAYLGNSPLSRTIVSNVRESAGPGFGARQSNHLLGTWSGRIDHDHFSITFSANGSFSALKQKNKYVNPLTQIQPRPRRDISFSGGYHVEGGSVIMHVTFSQDSSINGEQFVMIFNGNKLLTSDRKHIFYRR